MTTLALRSKNCGLFFGGQGISLVGTWMTKVAAVWSIYQLGGSALPLGLAGFADQIPSLFLSPFAGVLIDRWNRQQVLRATQTLSALQSLALAFLTLTERIDIASFLVLSFCQGCINAFDVPARQAFIAEIVDSKEDIGEAIAVNSLTISSARLFGPSLAAIAISGLGAGLCFLIDGLSYLPLIAVLFIIKPKKELAKKTNSIKYQQETNPWQQLQQGFAYAARVSPVGWILLLLALVGFMAMPYTYLAPIFAKETLGGGSDTLGVLMAFAGLGSFSGSLYLMSRKSPMGLEKIAIGATAITGISLIGFSMSETLFASSVALYFIGLCLVLQVAASNILLQTLVPDEKRGRVMSLFALAYLGMLPLGSLMAGAVAELIGAATTLSINGGICLLAAFLLQPKIVPLKRTR
ncbi:MAG: MFS transporter [Oscillatoria sp. SIO1A7]|nr:MFS transporter [Oscillatoria sp. SIO1A7]